VIRGLALAIVALAVTRVAAAGEPLPRRAHVSQALAAVRGLGPDGRDRLDRALYEAARTQCRADTGAPAVSCLVGVARAACAGDPARPRCEAAADVIVANLRSTSGFVDDATRIRLVRGSADYHAALAGELHRRYAALAAELVLSGGAAGSDDAAAIDELCLHRDRQTHACQPGDPACIASVPWSRCVAALVWFVGGSP